MKIQVWWKYLPITELKNECIANYFFKALSWPSHGQGILLSNASEHDCLSWIWFRPRWHTPFWLVAAQPVPQCLSLVAWWGQWSSSWTYQKWRKGWFWGHGCSCPFLSLQTQLILWTLDTGEKAIKDTYLSSIPRFLWYQEQAEGNYYKHSYFPKATRVQCLKEFS